MALPNTFAANTQSTGQELDDNFNALGALVVHPGTLTGTNALSMSLLSDTPTITAFSNYMMFVGVAANTNADATTLTVGSVGPLSVYKDTTDSGPIALAGGEIIAGNAYGFIYDSALNTGAGGFHLLSLAVANTLLKTVVFNALVPQVTQDQTVTFAGAKVNDIVTIGPTTTVTSGIMYMGFVPAAGSVILRAANITAATTITPAGSVFRIGLRGEV